MNLTKNSLVFIILEFLLYSQAVVALIFYSFLFGYKLGFPSILTGEILVFYLPICFFYYLAKLIILTGRAGFLVFFS